jgi:adenosylcobalamin phosphodiesterase
MLGDRMFRIGTTSYILPDEILPNVVYLAPLVDDVELVLFETDDHGSNLPDACLVERLLSLATEHDLTYTVHLPLDLRSTDDGGDREDPGTGASGGGLDSGDHGVDVSLLRARRVIEATRDLDPLAYTLHLDGSDLLGPTDRDRTERWQLRSRRLLEGLCAWVDRPDRLCVENVEAWDPEAFAAIIEVLPVGRTVDIGHLWLQQVDPTAHLERWLHRTRVVHLHGIADRDHASLANIPAERLDPVVALLAARFSGVLTLEVFDQEDLLASLGALTASLERVGVLAAIEGRVRWPGS